MSEVIEAIKIIKEKFPELKKGHGGAGEIECPKCKGKLHFSVAGLNGHIWGKCETKGCLAWMM